MPGGRALPARRHHRWGSKGRSFPLDQPRPRRPVRRAAMMFSTAVATSSSPATTSADLIDDRRGAGTERRAGERQVGVLRRGGHVGKEHVHVVVPVRVLDARLDEVVAGRQPRRTLAEALLDLGAVHEVDERRAQLGVLATARRRPCTCRRGSRRSARRTGWARRPSRSCVSVANCRRPASCPEITPARRRRGTAHWRRRSGCRTRARSRGRIASSAIRSVSVVQRGVGLGRVERDLPSSSNSVVPNWLSTVLRRCPDLSIAIAELHVVGLLDGRGGGDHLVPRPLGRELDAGLLEGVDVDERAVHREVVGTARKRPSAFDCRWRPGPRGTAGCSPRREPRSCR